ncbi:DUF389 domain-containing protein [Nitrospira moscoviensis]|uniref:TIGR00341 family protein n=1 Tax=Nitrospira moscoviensis TaxID=42253 RepID=A0A0K2GEU3_NITMO|nr:DUF389 domain-containing protein [Nitrospira moscoviensis]ALA59132.1 conserved membrane protein of unknown function [Nitrospira moscoviensis]
MRQLLIQVPRGSGSIVLQAARRREGTDLLLVEASDGGQATDLVVVHIANSRVDQLLADVQEVDGLRISLIPRGVMTLQPPAERAARQVVDVTPRSALEIVLGGLQSVGSWTGFLGYAAAAGVVVWIGLFTNTVYLLTAAMLIAPYAGPAMNAAIATARGDAALLGRSLLRYGASLSLTIAVAAALSRLFRQQIATDQMVAVSQLSSAAVLLPLAAGAAGALTLVQSDRNSLVSGAAVGLLVAASLAPPAGLIGMAGAVGEWDMAISGAFLLALQLIGINLSGAAVFRWYGLSPTGVRYRRGRPWVARATAAVSLAALAALVVWQLWDRPQLQRSSRAERAAETIKQVVDDSGFAALAEADVRFTRADIRGQHTLLGVLYVQRTAGDLSDGDIRERLLASIHRRLRQEDFAATPLIDVTVLHAPDRGERSARP